MKKELSIYIIILLLLSVLMHLEEFFSYPIEHLINLSTSGAYGLGSFHPFVFAFIGYLFLFLPRILIRIFKK